MGLDTVELILAFEKRFGTSIPDEDAADLYTPRRVTDYLVSGEVGNLMSRDELQRLFEKCGAETAIKDFDEDSHFVYDMNLD